MSASINEKVNFVYFNCVRVIFGNKLVMVPIKFLVSCQLSDCKCRNTCSRKYSEKKKVCPSRTASCYCSHISYVYAEIKRNHA
jgi:hypothetical protein